MLGTYLQISLGVSVVILLNLLLKYLFNKHYASSLSYAVWILCAVMLLIPYKPEAQIKIYVSKIEEYKAAIVKPTKNTNTENITADDNTSLDWHNSAKSVTTPMSSEHNIPYLLTVIRIIWGLGTLIFMMYHIIGYVIFCRRIKPWCRTVSIEGYNGKPILTECRVIKSPMLVGFFYSRIILPRYDYTENELNMILKHELTHYKRGDLWFKMLFIVANAIHWFNPFVYILRHAANRDMEYSCDEKVVKNKDINFRRDYSMTILRCASGGIKTTFSTYFNEDKKILKQRFSNILTSKKRRGIIMCIIIALAAALCVGAVGLASSDDKKTAYVFIGTDKQNHIDTIMAAEIGKKGIAVTSIPRDTVDIDAYTLECSESSVEMILSAIPKLLGFTADKYIIADTDSTMTFLSMLGNVSFEIPDLFGDGVGMVYDDSYQDLHISLPSGEHELSGKEMLDVMRYRRGNTNDSGVYNAYAEGDIDRIKMTHTLLNAIVSQKKDVIFSDEIFHSVHNIMLSSNTNIELTDLRKLFKALKNGGITFKLLDGKYEKDINGVLFYIPQTYIAL